mgnify:CR=1 FL=1
MVLNALRTIAPISRVTVDTYQSVSGTGTAAVTELKEQTANIVNNKSPEVTRTRLYLETVEEVFAKMKKFVITNPEGILPFLPLDEGSSINQGGSE